MSRPAIDFMLYVLGLRQARTSVGEAERALLLKLTKGRRSVVEVGVFEGVTSAALAEALEPGGHLWLVDPYERGTRPERWFGFSFSERIARRTVRPWSERVTFVRRPSVAAAMELDRLMSPDLVFIDADHSYLAVRDDFFAWASRLAPEGIIAFHDSRCCSARPDLRSTTGPVRLIAEILDGVHGKWILVNSADSVTAVTRRAPDV